MAPSMPATPNAGDGVSKSSFSAGSTAFHLLLNLLFTLIALFVFYRDGDRIVAQLDKVGARILPGRWTHMSRVVPATISATVTGMTLIAIVVDYPTRTPMIMTIVAIAAVWIESGIQPDANNCRQTRPLPATASPL